MKVEKVSEKEFDGLVEAEHASIERIELLRARVRQDAERLWDRATREGPLKVTPQDPSEGLLLWLLLEETKPEGAELLKLYPPTAFGLRC